MTTVALLGTGTMGAGMARSLLRAGHAVRVWNRTAARADPLRADGAEVLPTAAEAVDAADVVVLMLFDTAAVLEVLTEIAGSVSGAAVVLQTSTIGPAGTAEVARLAAEHGLRLLDAPVLGTKQPAEQGSLVVLASGDPELLPAVRPVLAAIGSRTVWVGDRLGQASTLKLVCNSWIASLTAAIGQSMALARAADLDPQLFLDAIKGSATDNAYLALKGAAILADEFPTSFAVDGVVKDVGLMQDLATAVGVPTTLLDAVHAVFASSSARGHGSEDMAAVVHGFSTGGFGTGGFGTGGFEYGRTGQSDMIFRTGGTGL